MLKDLKFSTYVAKDDKGDDKRYYVIERRIFLFIWRTELTCTNYKAVSKWIKDRLDLELEKQKIK